MKKTTLFLIIACIFAACKDSPKAFDFGPGPHVQDRNVAEGEPEDRHSH